VVKSGGRVIFLSQRTSIGFESCGNYVTCTSAELTSLRTTMNALEPKLTPTICPDPSLHDRESDYVSELALVSR
jgi:hypothetical protein